MLIAHGRVRQVLFNTDEIEYLNKTLFFVPFLVQIIDAFNILLSDKQVKAILVNIFGGIMKCDVIAGGIVSAAKQLLSSTWPYTSLCMLLESSSPLRIHTWMPSVHVGAFFLQVALPVPLVVRLEGTNVAQGKEILKNSGMTIITADDLDDAAKKGVAAISA
eukprot:1159597-Pelagomonas_calceolata.AAC.1